jgi:maltose alpha-D-glucosyltransferase/alpha-amylase
VEAQERDPRSLLNRVRRLVALRKAHPALCASGGFEAIYARAGKCPFIYRRRAGRQSILVALNPSERAVEAPLPDGLVSRAPRALHGVEGAVVSRRGRWRVRLPPVSGGAYAL